MSNQEDASLTHIMPADEQAAILRDAVLGHHKATMAQLQSFIAELNEQPDLITRDHVKLVKDAVKHQVEWLRAHGIDAYCEVTEATGLDDVKAGDRL